MNTIRVEPFNETYVKIHCDDGVAMELHEYFTFKAKNYQFDPKYKKGHWNGDIHLFTLKWKRIYKGLLDHVKGFCESRGYELELDERLRDKPQIGLGRLRVWLDEELKPVDDLGRVIQFRDAQVSAVAEVIQRDRVLLLSPTNSGKSLIIYALIRYFETKKSLQGKKILVVVPTTGLIHQMVSDFGHYSKLNGWDTGKIHTIYQGQAKITPQQVVISTWQSMQEQPSEYFKQFGAVICDEVHGATAQVLKSIIENASNAKFRVGMTGTLDDCLTHHLVLTGLFGKIVRVDHTHKMIERGEAAKLNIKMLFLKHSEESCVELAKIKREPHVTKDGHKMKKTKTMHYADEVKYIAQSKKRNLFVKNLALNVKGNALVLFKHIDHGEELYNLISTDARANRKVFLVHGENTDGDARNKIRAIVEKENDAIIIASYGVFSTGISIRNLHNLILAVGTKSKIKILQSLGRMLRMSPTKFEADVYDISDDLSYKDDRCYSVEHAMNRADIYAREKFPFTVHKLEI